MAKISRRTALLGLGGVGLAGIGAVGIGLAGRTNAPAAAPPTRETPAPVSQSPTPTPKPAPKPPVDSRPRWPLTGVLLENPKKAQHPAVAVKVPDNKYEHPQRGIDEADIVFVQLEGYLDADGYSGTRLVPVFHSRMAETVMPVRSIRPVDIPLLSPIDAIIGNTGAARWVINYVKHYRKHVEGMLSYMNTRGTGSYGTDPSRVYTYQGQTYYDRATVCHPAVLAKQTKRFRKGPQQSYFPWASSSAEVSTVHGKKAKTIEVPYKGDGYRMSYAYDKKSRRYRRSMPWGPHVMADGKRIAVDNVLVIKAKQHFGKIYSGSGHDEPLHDIIDKSGTFYYANRGRYVTGTWRKGGVAKPFQFTLADGTPLKMATGQTFVELPDDGAKIRIKD
ncbi:MAG TPA: DUF3048 domain-containing protein [Microlunatus sp.]|nr:DUF3048 domain-containing protein [Microlunatus sp.]